MPNHSPTELARAQKLVEQIRDKVETLLRPLQHEMLTKGFSPELRAIMWDAVSLEAEKRRDAARGNPGLSATPRRVP